jgi:hypothetical protein
LRRRRRKKKKKKKRKKKTKKKEEEEEKGRTRKKEVGIGGREREKRGKQMVALVKKCVPAKLKGKNICLKNFLQG